MRLWIRKAGTRILLAMIFSGPIAAHADEPEEFIEISPPNFAEGRKLRIPIFSEEGCRAIIDNAYAPERTISKGLNALAEASTPKATPNLEACLEMLPNFPERVIPGEFKFSPPPPEEPFQLPYPKFSPDLTKRKELGDKWACYLPRYQGVYSALKDQYKDRCKGRWFEDDATFRRLQEETKIEDERIEREARDYEDAKNVGAALFELLKEDPPPGSPEPHAGTMQANARLREFFDFHGSYEGVDRMELVRLTRRSRCHNPFPPGSPERQAREKAKASLCGDQPWLSDQDLENMREKTRAVFGNYHQRVADWENVKRRRLAVINDWRFKENRERSEDYALWRVLLAYRSWAKNGKTGSKEFCREQRAKDLRDKTYFQNLLRGQAFSKSEDWNSAVRFGLSEAEFGAIRDYMGNYYQNINPPLYEGRALTGEQLLFKEVLDAGLAKLPTHQGFVRRHLNFNPTLLAAHKVGQTVCYSAYSSASKFRDWEWRGDTHMLIFSLTGRAVFQMNPAEGEVLFEPGTCFKVVGHQPGDKDVKHRYVLQEANAPEVSANAWSTYLSGEGHEAAPKKKLAVPAKKKGKHK